MSILDEPASGPIEVDLRNAGNNARRFAKIGMHLDALQKRIVDLEAENKNLLERITAVVRAMDPQPVSDRPEWIEDVYGDIRRKALESFPNL